MIKRTLYFGNPAYLSMRNSQLVIRLPEVEKSSVLPDSFKKEAVATIPIEDIGVVFLDHKQITVTQSLIEALLSNNVALITCDNAHMPVGLMLPLDGNHIQSERFRSQITATLPLKKQLWAQTIAAKIQNQAHLLRTLHGTETGNMKRWLSDLKPDNAAELEARAAVYYWKNIFPSHPGFTRGREGEPPNNLLNYGYAILRAVIARALVGSGLLPTFGIFHRNKYNAYCLADDIMEPYRPFVDKAVYELTASQTDISVLNTDIKTTLLSIPTTDVLLGNRRHPLMIAAAHTTASLSRCFNGESRKILYPTFID